MSTDNNPIQLEPDPEPPMLLEPDDPLGGALDPPMAIEPDEVVTGAANAAAPAAGGSAALAPVATPLAELLPADFPLPDLIHFVPNAQLKEDLDRAVTYALSLRITGEGQAAIARGDAAVTALKQAMAAVERNFERACELAHQVHKQLTSRRAAWLEHALLAVKNVGRRVADETLRLEEEARKAARLAQDEANARAREEAAREAAAAAKQGAPAAVVEQMQETAKTVTAPPVAIATPVAPRTNTVTQTWKARIKGSPAEADPNPEMTQLSPLQRAQVIAAMKAVLDGKESITIFAIDWKVINARARAEKGAMAIIGFEAYVDTGLRAKPGARR